MTSLARYLVSVALASGLFLTLAAPFHYAQAPNGQIEGVVLDQTKGAVENADIIAVHVETGAHRSTSTDSNGVYRFPLLSPGSWRINAGAPGFRKVVREGVELAAGQTTTVDFELAPGEVSESVTVSGSAPIADPGTTLVGRVINGREANNIPSPTRNPYNFVILEGNVTGRPARGFNFPQVNVNGFARRVNYLLEGNVNTQPDRAGARLMMTSDVYVSEIQIITNGFAPEFGNTTGMIMNIITPSGANDLRGSAGYLFRRPSFYSRPFFYSGAKLPDNVTDNVIAALGGPIVKNRWHFYSGFEHITRDDSTRSTRQVTISEANRIALIQAGLPSSIFVPAIPSQERGALFIVRTDVQLDRNNSLMARFNRADVGTENNIVGNLNTMERSSDVVSRDDSVGIQLMSFSSRILNELRFQYAKRFVYTERNESSGTGPSITIPTVASFGSPTDGDTIAPLINIVQVQDNFNWTSGSHAIKFGGSGSVIDLKNRAPRFALYTFPSIEAYRLARTGNARRGYIRYEESFGDPDSRYKASYWSVFLQDDWKVTRRLKLNYGVRYDLYLVPKADTFSPFPASRRFNVDKNNLAPRFGFAYALREGSRPLVLRGGAGIYFEPPLLEMYGRALLNNGTPTFFSLRFCGEAGGSTCPTDGLAPAFPNTFSGSQPPGTSLPRQDVVTVSTDFVNMYAIHSNIQLEQALTDDLSLAVGYVHSGGRHIPVYRNINPINPIRQLADGRPVFSSAVTSATRVDPRFNVIQMAESAAVSQYDALTISLRQRLSHGIQFSANYTLSKATDDAPEQNIPYMLGGNAITSFVLSDPTNRAFDRGYSYGDQRHTFVMSMVARPDFNIGNRVLRSILNNNQVGMIATANSGERFTITSGVLSNGTLSPVDLNGDGLSFSDRPVGIKRNSGKTPPQFNLDVRYSRFIPLSERYRLEGFLEVQNLFNINSIVAYNNTLALTNVTTGELIGPLPNFKGRNASTSLESRQAQVGIKFHF
jgi:hypothetical protein